MSKKLRLMLIVVLAFTVAMSLGSPLTSAASFPTKEIKLIVPWGPGGATDLMARAMQPIFKEKFGATLVVINKPGGGSAVGLAELITSKPDGYTLGVASSSILALMALDEVKWGTDKFSNIALVSEDPLLLLVKAGGQFKSIDDFMKYVKANPGKVTVGTSGSRNVNHALAVLAADIVGSEIRQVPFDSGSKTMAALLGGHIDAAVLKPSETMAQINSGEALALGVFRDKRLSVLPNVPTFKEAGYDVFKAGRIAQVSYIVAPAGVPKDVQEKLAGMFREVLGSKEFQEFAAANGFVAEPMTGSELDSMLSDLYKALKQVAVKVFKQ